MKIGELVNRTNVSKQLIHHYLREGMLKKPLKTGVNTAEYDETHVEQILLIKNLRDKYFLPLPMIKKIIKRQKKLPQPEKLLFQLQSQHLRPIDRFFPHDVDGREAFRAATGLSDYWLGKMEQWAIISPEIIDGEPIYDQTEVEMGRLIVSMDRLGFGPKDGYHPEFLRQLGDQLRDTLAASTNDYIARNMDKLDTDEFSSASVCYSEVLSLFVYLLFKKIMRQETMRILEDMSGDDEAQE